MKISPLKKTKQNPNPRLVSANETRIIKKNFQREGKRKEEKEGICEQRLHSQARALSLSLSHTPHTMQ